MIRQLEFAKIQKGDRLYRRKFFKKLTPYSTRYRTCARAHCMMELAKFRRWKTDCIPSKLWRCSYFQEWLITR